MKGFRFTVCFAMVTAGFLLLFCEPPSCPGAEEATEASQSSANSEKQYSFWMEQKLRLSKDILTGLAVADFDKIGKGAEVMRGLNRLERFVRRSPAGYRDELTQFNQANKALVRAAQKENLEAATLAFNQLTISCVSCHKVMREADEAEVSAPSSK